MEKRAFHLARSIVPVAASLSRPVPVLCLPLPLKIVGVRALEMKDDKAVIDIDLRWAGNAEFVLEAGVKPVPLLITLNKICFSGRMRVELAPLVPVFPCFGAGAGLAFRPPFVRASP